MKRPLLALVERLRAEGLLLPDVALPPPDRMITGISTDSRQLREGGLFCAVRGTTTDGHHYLAAAQEAGAVAALVETVDPTVSIPQIVVHNGRRAAAFAAAEFYADPWNDLLLIGVTGTNGKTTTTQILRHLLSVRGPAASIGTLGIVGPDGAVVPGSTGLTTPGPVEFTAQLRSLVDQGVQAVAMEVSSHALDQDRVAAALFAGAVFTNLSRDHLDYHGSFERYREAKLKLVERIRPGGVLAVNTDEEAWEGIGREGVHTVGFGTLGRGEVVAEEIVFRPSGADWNLFTPSCTAPVRLPLYGSYNVSNALGAAALLWGLGWSADTISAGLASMPQIPGRLEAVHPGTRPAVLIDFAHTPDALERALHAVRPLVEGRLILVFGAGGDRDTGKRAPMGSAAAEAADYSIVTSDNPRHEDPARIAEQIEAGMGDAPRTRILDRKQAIEYAIEMAEPNDLVLLAGKGHERDQIWGAEHRPFDERVIVDEIFRRKGIAR